MPMTERSATHDQATQERLLQAAAPLFAERGFKDVAVRDICRKARANVAAVNYHFGNKLGLYREVVRLVAQRMTTARIAAMEVTESDPPEKQLRDYISTFITHLMSEEEGSWIEKLMGREMAEPTPALDLIIELGIKPNADRLGALIARLLKCSPSDERVWMCAVSIQSQCLFYRTSKPVFARMLPGHKFTPQLLERIAAHIADFSLAGIRHLALRKDPAKS
jgi:TetR/AcrR family transcriptional regulator, regulator of cefoperazone and chloramphenicol sensitivity